MPKLVVLFYGLLVLLSAGCKKDSVKIITINPLEFSVEDQVKIGEAFQKAIQENPSYFPILNRVEYSAAYDYVGFLLNTIRNTPSVERRTDFEWSLSIIQTDTLRTAFFLPGGHFYIYSGLLKYLDNESQLLGVLGHELYYADTDIMVERMREQFGGTTLGDILLGNEVENLGELTLDLPNLDFKEKEVLEADSFAVNLLCPFQYEPIGIKYILEKADATADPELHWVTKRMAQFDIRISNLERMAIHCGLPGVMNEDPYKNFKEQLIP